ncbi:unnamed protein product, partial [Mesorhabditis spiculigera]
MNHPHQYEDDQTDRDTIDLGPRTTLLPVIVPLRHRAVENLRPCTTTRGRRRDAQQISVSLEELDLEEPVLAQRALFVELECKRDSVRDQNSRMSDLQRQFDAFQAEIDQLRHEKQRVQALLEVSQEESKELRSAKEELTALLSARSTERALEIPEEAELRSEIARLENDKRELRKNMVSISGRANLFIDNIRSQLDVFSNFVNGADDDWFKKICDANNNHVYTAVHADLWAADLMKACMEMAPPEHPERKPDDASQYGRQNAGLVPFAVLRQSLLQPVSQPNEHNTAPPPQASAERFPTCSAFSDSSHPAKAQKAPTEGAVKSKSAEAATEHKPYVSRIPVVPSSPLTNFIGGRLPSETPDGEKLAVHQHAEVENHPHGKCYVRYPCGGCQPMPPPGPPPHTTYMQPPPYPNRPPLPSGRPEFTFGFAPMPPPRRFRQQGPQNLTMSYFQPPPEQPSSPAGTTQPPHQHGANSPNQQEGSHRPAHNAHPSNHHRNDNNNHHHQHNQMHPRNFRNSFNHKFNRPPHLF